MASSSADEPWPRIPSTNDAQRKKKRYYWTVIPSLPLLYYILRVARANSRRGGQDNTESIEDSRETSGGGNESVRTDTPENEETGIPSLANRWDDSSVFVSEGSSFDALEADIWSTVSLCLYSLLI